MAAEDKIRVYEQWALEPTSGSPAVQIHTHEQWLVYAGIRAADYTDVSEQWLLEAGDGPEVTVPEVHEQWVLLAVSEQIPTTPVGSWTYEIDGHLFYGLNLGAQGTTVYDATTQRWSDWQSGTLPWMNMNLTVVWNGETHGASLIDPILVKFNPDSVVDDSFRENSFIVSGRVEYQDRDYVAMPEAQVIGSVGLRGGSVKLRYSNDDGASWSTDRALTVAAGARGTNVVFYDLGSVRSPGRLIEIEDSGTLRRVAAIRVNLEGADGGQG